MLEKNRLNRVGCGSTGFVEVPYGSFAKEEAEDSAGRRSAQRYAHLGLQSAPDRSRSRADTGSELLVRARPGELFERREPGRHGQQRIARQSPGLVDRARPEQSGSSSRGGPRRRRPAIRRPPPFPDRSDRASTPKCAWAHPPAEPKPGDDLIEDQQRPEFVATRAKSLEKARNRRHEAHVSGHRLDDDAGDLLAPPFERVADRGDIVVRGLDRSVLHSSRARPASRDPERRDPATGAEQQRVDVAVVAALELEHAVAAGRRAGQAQCAHRGLGARADHSELLYARDRPFDLLRQLDLSSVGAPKLVPLDIDGANRLQDRRIRRGR